MAYETHENYFTLTDDKGESSSFPAYLMHGSASVLSFMCDEIVCMRRNNAKYAFYIVDDDSPACVSEWIESAKIYTSLRGEITEIEYHEGYIGRWTMPGYMDCSEWETAETESELMENLRDHYGDDDDGTSEQD